MLLKPDREYRFFAPPVNTDVLASAVIFAPQGATINIDGVTSNIPEEGYLMLGSGIHTIRSSNPLIVQILGGTGEWNNWGSYIPYWRDVLQPPISLKPSSKPTNPLQNPDVLGGISIAAIIAIVILYTFITKRKTQKKLK